MDDDEYWTELKEEMKLIQDDNVNEWSVKSFQWTVRRIQNNASGGRKTVEY